MISLILIFGCLCRSYFQIQVTEKYSTAMCYSGPKFQLVHLIINSLTGDYILRRTKSTIRCPLLVIMSSDKKPSSVSICINWFLSPSHIWSDWSPNSVHMFEYRQRCLGVSYSSKLFHGVKIVNEMKIVQKVKVAKKKKWKITIALDVSSVSMFYKIKLNTVQRN